MHYPLGVYIYFGNGKNQKRRTYDSMIFNSKKNIYHLVKICILVGLFLSFIAYISTPNVQVSFKWFDSEDNTKEEVEI